MDQIALGSVYISVTLSIQEFVSNMFYLKTINNEIIICAVSVSDWLNVTFFFLKTIQSLYVQMLKVLFLKSC